MTWPPAFLSPPQRQVSPEVMGMADGTSQCIGSIGLGHTIQAQQGPHHVLHLFFVGMASAHGRLLDLQRRVFRHRQLAMTHGAQSGTTGLAQLERRVRIAGDKDFFDSDGIRLVFGNKGGNAVIDYL